MLMAYNCPQTTSFLPNAITMHILLENMQRTHLKTQILWCVLISHPCTHTPHHSSPVPSPQFFRSKTAYSMIQQPMYIHSDTKNHPIVPSPPTKHRSQKIFTQTNVIHNVVNVTATGDVHISDSPTVAIIPLRNNLRETHFESTSLASLMCFVFDAICSQSNGRRWDGRPTEVQWLGVSLVRFELAEFVSFSSPKFDVRSDIIHREINGNDRDISISPTELK